MKDTTNKALWGNSLLFSKGTLAVLAAVIVLVSLIGSRRFLHADAGNTAPNNPVTESGACRFVLASLNGNEPLDEEIARQQALVRS
jgi:hypothetical protein